MKKVDESKWRHYSYTIVYHSINICILREQRVHKIYRAKPLKCE